MADMIATGIGWPTGSPFQTELAFSSLGIGVAAMLTIWLRGHLITGLVIAKALFWYGSAATHLVDAIQHENYAPLNVGAPLIGDVVYPTLMLWLLWKAWPGLPGRP
jgi:hypothetical protein